MDQSETSWDKLLKIRTSGRDDSNADQYKYPYEPTPYSVLERLAAEGRIGRKNIFLDYGCGKGRVDFFLAYQTGCHAIGVEYDSKICSRAIQNRESAVSGRKVEFVQADAAEYKVPAEVDRIFFFNPFSVEILRTVYARILESYYENPREIQLFFYYPSDEYIAFLMTQDEMEFDDEIDCRDLFPGENPRERVLIMAMGTGSPARLDD